jgi:hypothetical protein
MSGTNWVAVGGLALAALSIVKDFLLERTRRKREFELKRYEVTFLEKHRAFADLFAAMTDIFHAASDHGGRDDLRKAYHVESNALHGLMPFLPVSDHEWLGKRATEIEGLARDLWNSTESAKDPGEMARLHDAFYEKMGDFRTKLFSKLFRDADLRL